MDFGNTIQTQFTEKIMAQIREHLKQEPPPHESHHYNRTYEKVHRILTEFRIVTEFTEKRGAR